MMQLCFFKVAQEAGRPQLWWAYTGIFSVLCTMKAGKYTPQCAKEIQS